MFKITSKAKHGGIWNGTRVVKEFETKDAVVAELCRKSGCEMEEIETPLFRCPYCDKQYQSEAALNKHIAEKHGDKNDNNAEE